MSGEAEVVVATNAFGMGVDKADIRSVIHFNMPGDARSLLPGGGPGRSRRPDPAECVLLYLRPGDRFLQEMFIENEYPPPDAVFRVYEFLRKLDADPIELTHAEIKERRSAGPERVGRRHGAENPRRGRGGRAVPASREHGDRPDQRRARRLRA